MGTISIFGTNENDEYITEVVTPVAGSSVSTTNKFKTVLTVTGAGWFIDGAEGSNDTIKIGVPAVTIESDYYISALQIVADAVCASQTDVSGHTGVQLSDFTSLPAGHVFPCKCTKIALTSGEAIAYLARV
jgi:hypothetical protein